VQWVGALRVLGVRIAWHVKRPTSSTVKRMAVARAGNEQISMRTAGSEPGRRRASKATPANQVHAVRTVLGERSRSEERGRSACAYGPYGFRKSTRDAKARSAAEEHTNEARGGGGSPGVRRPGVGLGQRSDS